MDRFTNRVGEILERAPTRALALSELLSTLTREGMDVGEREEWILKRLSEEGAAFSIIPHPLGPWSQVEGRTRPCSRRTWPSRLKRDPWIMTRASIRSGTGPEPRTVGRIQETLQAWGREVDGGSQSSVARWIRANREAARTCDQVRKGRAGRNPSTTRLPGRSPRD